MGGEALDQKFPFYLQDTETTECVRVAAIHVMPVELLNYVSRIYIHMIEYIPSTLIVRLLKFHTFSLRG